MPVVGFAEIPRAKTWLATQLAGLAGGRVYDTTQPEQAPVWPVIIYQYQTGSDTVVLGARRIWAELLFVVKAITQADGEMSIQALADSIDLALQAQSGNQNDFRINACVRERPFELVEINEGLKYYHLGGIYRIYVQPFPSP